MLVLTETRRPGLAYAAIALPAFWAAYAGIALALGRDTNWDLRNYHFYNAYALFEGRVGWDLAPANAQTFIHPGLDIPFYLLATGALNAWPRLVTVLQAGHCAVLGTVTLALANLVCNGRAARVSPVSALAALFGLTGAITISEAGTTHNDVPIGALVVGALLVALCGARRGGGWFVAAGAIAGAAAAFKLTAAIYAPGLVLAAAIVGGWRAGLLAAAGAAAGFVLVYAPWGWFLYRHWDNPFGPYLNGLIRSPWFPPESLRDPRFLPRGLLETVIYPLLWARPSVDLVTEATVADPRFAVGLGSVLAVAGCWLSPRGRVHPPATLAVLAFLLVSYLAWLAGFGILRYALPLEALLGIPVWAAIMSLAALCGGKRHLGTAALALIFAGGAAVTVYPDWGRAGFGPMQGLPPAAVTAERVQLPPDSLVVTLWGAVAFMAPFLTGDGVRFTSAPHPDWAGDGRFAQQAEALIRAHPGPVYALLEDPANYDRDLARRYGLVLEPADCHAVRNNLTAPVHLCRIR